MVINACEYYSTSTSGHRAMSDRVLKDYYGCEYKTKLCLDFKDPSTSLLPRIETPEITAAGEGIENGYFLYNNSKYDINCAFDLAGDPFEINLDEVKWILSEIPKNYFDDDFEKMRLDVCKLSDPILITKDDKMGVIVLDGIHQIQKAINEKTDTVLAKEISSQVLSKCKIHNDEIIGGYDEIIGGDDEIDDLDIEELLNSQIPQKQRTQPSQKIVNNDFIVDFEPGVEYVTNVHLFPEDNFSELKDKIYLATDIPAYRQHIFWVNRGRIFNTYQLHAEGIYNVDIRNISYFTNNIRGIPIDKTLYDLRDSIRIEAQDTFRIIGGPLTEYVAYVVDLAQFTNKIHTQLMEIMHDTYQFELLYFGFIIKYWPQLTRECFYDYMRAESELQHIYPDLAKNKINLMSVYKNEKDIINEDYKNISKSSAYVQNTGLTIAITQMIATVGGARTVLNIRNLFDKLRATRCIPEIHAYVDYNNKKYMLRKRHIRNGSDIQFPSGNLMKNGVTIAISLRKSDQETFHTKNSVSTMENEQSRYLFLNIWPNGRYYIRTVWNEEDELGFDDIIKVMKRFTDPIINGINNLGKYVFNSGKSLPLITKQNISYQSLNICVFWKKVMIANTFKVVRGLWDLYMRAKIIGPRNVQQFDKFEFLFRKGMHEFDVNAIDRIISASNNIVLTNQYAYLSNNTIKQKWDQNYDGRIVRMTHRTTDIRFEVEDIREHEFQIFYKYIISFVYRAINNEKVKQELTTSKSYDDVKKLRKLREQDPELFNLKKYGSKKVYSILCQNPRQPLIYTPDEIKSMSAADVKRLVEYWNFTLNKPAYYGCPNKKYPHLNFMVGVHPKHYCLPCCHKKPHLGEESKKTRINSVCLQKHKFIQTDSDQGPSRHIMGYGKDIDLGRLSKMPTSSVKNLLFNTLDSPHMNYYLFGVPQHVPGVENIGIVYTIAEALDIPMEELIRKIIVELKKPVNEKIFSILIHGSLAEYFRSMNELIDVFSDLFLNMKMFTRGLQRFKQWNELFTELVHLLFNINIFTFIDDSGTGESLELFVPDNTQSEILYLNKLQELSTDKFLITLKRQNRYYPVFVIDDEKFHKSHEIAVRIYSGDMKIIRLFCTMVTHASREEELNVDKVIDLTLIKAFASEWKITRKFINKQNLCYAVLIEKNKNIVYVPIEYSVYLNDGIEITFDVFSRTEHNLKFDVLMQFIESLNNYIRTNHSVRGSTELFSYRLLKAKEYISLMEKIIGLKTEDNLIFYFDDIGGKIVEPIVELSYELSEVNKAIINRLPPNEDPRRLKIGEALYDNYLYQLFVIEFINYLSNERNEILREKLKQLFKDTNFKKDISDFRKTLKELLAGYPEDNTIVQNQLIAFYRSGFDKKTLYEQIDSTDYNFDHMTFNRLKTIDHADMINELKKISKTFSVEKEFDSTNVKFPNIYMPCADLQENTGYCEKNKLIINKPIDEFVELLATDLMDPLKSTYLFNSMWSDTVTDWLSFTRFPTEIITIYRLTE